MDCDTKPSPLMIPVTRLNGETFKLNALQIEQVQSCPDTTITLTSSKKFVVKETEKEIVHLINNYYQMIGLIGCQKELGDNDEF